MPHKPMLTVYSLSHAAVDFACAFLVFRTMLSAPNRRRQSSRRPPLNSLPHRSPCRNLLCRSLFPRNSTHSSRRSLSP